jgi:hypothetical protein
MSDKTYILRVHASIVQDDEVTIVREVKFNAEGDLFTLRSMAEKLGVSIGDGMWRMINMEQDKQEAKR